MIEVLVALQPINLQQKDILEKFLKKKSFKAIKDEEFIYKSKSSTTIIATKTYILEIFSQALENISFDSCDIVFLINETTYPLYTYDKKLNEFIIIKND
jgi:hypothetical protein